MANHVFDQNHGAINDQSEIDGPQTHQISGKTKVAHSHEGEEHGKGNG